MSLHLRPVERAPFTKWSHARSQSLTRGEPASQRGHREHLNDPSKLARSPFAWRWMVASRDLRKDAGPMKIRCGLVCRLPRWQHGLSAG